MVDNNTEAKKLYNALIKRGYTTDDIGDESTFSNKISDKNNRKQLYDYVVKRNDFRIGDYDSFERRLGGDNQSPVVPSMSEQQKARFIGGARSIVRQSQQDTQDMQQQIEDARKYYGSSSRFVNGGVVKDNPRYNADTGKVEDRYIAPMFKGDEKGKVYVGVGATDNPSAAQHSAQDVRIATGGEDMDEDTLREQWNEDSLKQLEDKISAEIRKEDERLRGNSSPVMYGGETQMQAVEGSPEVHNYRTAQRYINEARRIIQRADEEKDGTFLGGAYRGFKDKLFDVDTWDFGIKDLGRNADMLKALDKADKGEELTDAERTVLDAAAYKLAVDAFFGSKLGRGYKAGEVTGESLPFMLQFALDPTASLGNKAVNKMARYALNRYGKQALKKNAKKYAASKFATQTLGRLGGAAAMTMGSGIGNTAAGTLDRMAGDLKFGADSHGEARYTGHEGMQDFGTALAKEIGAGTIENMSEMVGPDFSKLFGIAGRGIGKGLDKIGLGAVNDFIERVGSNHLAKAVTRFENKTQYHGVLEEYAEEKWGELHNALFVGDDDIKDFFDIDKNVDTLLGVSLMGGVFSIAKTAGYRTPKYEARKKLRTINGEVSHAFGNSLQQWENMRNRMQESDEMTKQTLQDIFRSNEYTAEQKEAALKYAVVLENLRGIERADNIVANDEQTEVADVFRQADRQAYEQGRMIATAQEMSDAKRSMDYYATRMRMLFGDVKEDEELEYLQTLGEGDAELALANMGAEYSAEQKRVAVNYLNARAKFDGMVDGIRDDVEGQREEAYREIDEAANKEDNMLHPAILEQGNRPVYVVSGNLVSYDDGSGIDNKRSSETIVVRDKETGKLEMFPASAFLSFDTPISAEEMKHGIDQRLDGTLQDKANVIDGVVTPIEEGGVTYNEGDTYLINDNGEERNVVISGVTEDGKNVNVLLEGEVPVTLPIEQFAGSVIKKIADAPQESEDTAEGEIADVEQPITEQTEKPATEQTTPAEQPAAEQPVAEQTEPKQPKVPLDKDNNPLYTQAKAEDTLADIYSKLDTSEAGEFIDANIAENQKILDKLNDKRPKVSADMNKTLAAKKAWNDAKKAAEDALAYWNNVKEEHNKLTHAESKLDTKEEVSDDVIENAEPIDAQEAIASVLGKSIKITPESFKAEGIGGTEEMRSMPGVVAGEDKGGMSIERAAEELAESGILAPFNVTDDADIRNMIIDVLSSGNPRGYVKKHRAELAKQEKEVQLNELENFAQKNFGMSAEEYFAYEETQMADNLARYKDVDVDELQAAFNEEQTNEEENDTDTTAGESDTSATDTTDNTSSEVLQETQPADAERATDDAERNTAGHETTGNEMSDENADAQEEEVTEKPTSKQSIKDAADTEPAQQQTAEDVNAKPFKAGLVRDEYTAKYTNEKLLDKIAKKLGVRIIFVDSIDRNGQKDVANADYEADSRTIFVQKFNENPIKVLMGHEITHRMRDLSEDAFMEYKKAAIAAMPDFAKRKEILRKRYAARNLSISDNILEEEVVADFAGELAFNEGTLEKFIHNSERNILERLLDFFKKVLSAFGEKDIYRTNIENAVNQLEKALDTAAKNAEKEGKQSNIRFSLIGEKGASNLDKANEATKLLDDLAVAREMESADKDAKSIKLATGWERGKDGKWRYETADIKIKYTEEDLFKDYLKGKENVTKEGVENFISLLHKSNLSEQEEELKDAALDYVYDLMSKEPKIIVKDLTDIVDDEELFRAYPEFKNIKVNIPSEGLEGSLRASYSNPEKRITMDMSYSESSIRSTLSHEIQHAIQYAEGFAVGGSPNDARGFLLREIEPYEHRMLNIRMSQNGIKRANNEIKELKKDSSEDSKNKIKELERKIEEKKRVIKEESLTPEEEKRYKEIRNKLDNKTPYGLYLTIAGETEARNVQTRMGMTPEQRRQTLAAETEDVAREDQIILNDTFNAYDKEVRYSLKNNAETEQIIADAKASGTYMLAPNGKKTNLSPKQWAQVRTKAFKDWFGDWENDAENASKVVDENGEPMVVYHGTNDTFTTFDRNKSDKGMGFFFTDNSQMAKSYGNNVMPVFLNIRDFSEIEGNGNNWNNLSASLISVTKDLMKSIEVDRNQKKLLMESGKYDSKSFKYFQDNYYKYLDKYKTLQQAKPKSLIEMAMKAIKSVYLRNKVRDFDTNKTILGSTRDFERYIGETSSNIIFRNILDYGKNIGENKVPSDVFVVYNPNQIKSATDNVGTFSKSNDDIRYSIKRTEDITTDDARKLVDEINSVLDNPSATRGQFDNAIIDLARLNASAYKGYGRISDEHAAYNAFVYKAKKDALIKAMAIAKDKGYEITKDNSNALSFRLEDGRQISFHGFYPSELKSIPMGEWDMVITPWKYTPNEYQTLKQKNKQAYDKWKDGVKTWQTSIKNAVKSLLKYQARRKRFGIDKKLADVNDIIDNAEMRIYPDFSYSGFVTIASSLNLKYDAEKELQRMVNEIVPVEPSTFNIPAYNNDIRYSLKDDKSLVGIHNISEDKLRKAIKMGGLANPSSAVIDIDKQDHMGYGEISLIMPSALVDKKTGRNVGTYAGDAWTPTYPQMEKRFTAKGEDKLNADIAKLPEDMQRISKASMASLDGNEGLSYMYMYEKGLSPKLIKNRSSYSDSVKNTVTSLMKGHESVIDLNEGAREQIFHAYIKDKFDGDVDKYKSKLAMQIERMKKRIKEKPNSIFSKNNGRRLKEIEDYGFIVNEINGFVNDVLHDEKNADKVNIAETDSKAREYITEHNLTDDFNKWVEEKDKEYGAGIYYFDGYTPSGYSKYKKATLENISKKMKSEGKTNVYDNTGFSATRALLLMKMNNLSDIRKHKDMLREDTDSKIKEATDNLFKITNRMVENKDEEGNPFVALDYANLRLQSALLKSNPTKYLNEEYGYTLDDDFADELNQFIKDVKNLPVKYFETKFERPVYLNEFAAAVVPNDVGEDIKKALDDAGVPMFDYEGGNDESRREATLKATEMEGVRFSLKDEGHADVFYSNAAHAVENIKQNKATPEQWLKMIEKNGGLKAGEDKWLGLSDWLKSSDAKTLTKDEVLDYIKSNEIQIEEVGYMEKRDPSKVMRDLYGDDIYEKYEISGEGDNMEVWFIDFGKAAEFYNKHHEDQVTEFNDSDKQKLRAYGNEILENVKKEIAKDKLTKEANFTRLDYTTRHLRNKREIAMTVPTIEPWNENDNIHFGDAGNGRAVAWARFGETTDADGNRVLVIDEVQSKRHQEGRENGYIPYGTVAELKKAAEEIEGQIEKAEVEYDSVAEEYRSILLDERRHNPRVKALLRDENGNSLSSLEIRAIYDGKGEKGKQFNAIINENKHLVSLRKEVEEKKSTLKNLRERYEQLEEKIDKIPDAPFDKNWSELAMKRMLRYAAENGYDKVAWTTGAQQAERYDLGHSVEAVRCDRISEDGIRTWRILFKNNAGGAQISANSDGIVTESTLEGIEGKNLSEAVGKEAAETMLNMKLDEEIKGSAFIGGSGMKAFYDKMIPSFMNKYVKKWGTKVTDVMLPELKEDDRVMHSVEVTPEMKESVMQGQPLFSLKDNHGTYTDAEISEANDPWTKMGVKRTRKQQEKFAKAERERMLNKLNELADKLHLDNVEVLEDGSGLNGKASKAKGFFNPKNGKITIILGNHIDLNDIQSTLLHEAVAHYGLRQLFGSNFDKFLFNVYKGATTEIRKSIATNAVRSDISMSEATEEYLASLAEDTDFEKIDATWWGKIKSMFLDMLHQLGFDGYRGRELIGDNELRYILWRSYENLKEPGKYRNMFNAAEDVVKQHHLGVGNYAPKSELQNSDNSMTQQQKAAYVISNAAGKDATYEQISSILSNEKELNRLQEENNIPAKAFKFWQIYRMFTKGNDFVEKLNGEKNEYAKLAEAERKEQEELAKWNEENKTGMRYSLKDDTEEELSAEETEKEKAKNKAETYEQRLTDAILELAKNHKESIKVREDAINKVRTTLGGIHRAMSIQKKYDKATVKDLTSLVVSLIQNDMLKNIRAGEVMRIVRNINAANGKEDISKYANNLIDVITQNLVRESMENLNKLTKVKAKTNQTGVSVIGSLDELGQTFVSAFRQYALMPQKPIDEENILFKISDIEDRIEKLREKGDDAAIKLAQAEIAGLELALYYKENIEPSMMEETILRQAKDTADEDLHNYKMTNEEYRQFVENINTAITENMVERVKTLYDIMSKISAIMSNSREAAKAFNNEQTMRRQEIHHNANSDMEGRPVKKQGAVKTLPEKITSSPVFRFFFNPLVTFDQILRMFGNKSVNGEGYLYRRFMPQFLEATSKEFKGVQSAFKTLDEKASDVMGRKMRWSDLYDMERKKTNIVLSFYDRGERVEHILTQGNALYIYMVNKMNDGKMKLSKMGITDADVENIKKKLDPRFVELADWVQEEFLPQLRSKYNNVHKRVFGVSMATIDNYFPLRILETEVHKDEDVSKVDDSGSLPSTATGSIIKRTRNAKAINVTDTDAFSVVVEHVQEMEHWAAFSEFTRDMNTLLSYSHFRNQVMSMNSIYGSGKDLWDTFRNVAAIAAGSYRPKVKKADLDAAAVNISKGVTGAKIAFRIFTAIKQILSFPAYFANTNPGYLTKSVLTPWHSWNWAMENLPIFEKRWKSRQAGDQRLDKSDLDWHIWNTKLVEKLGRWGMSPNAFVDAVTVAIGAKAIFDTAYSKYKAQGYSEEDSIAKAKDTAIISFNQTQQSNEKAFLSPMQLDRTLASVALTVFRNSSMGYQRQLVDAVRSLARHFKKGYKQDSIEFMTKQFVRDGLTETQAKNAAVKEYGKSFAKELMRAATFGYIMQFAWNMGAYLPYLLVGGDDDEKWKFIEDCSIHGLFGGVEGLAGGNIISDTMNKIAQGGDLSTFSLNTLPIVSDSEQLIQMLKNDKVAAANFMINLLVQGGMGVNPQTFTDLGVGIIDACDGDMGTAKEVTMLVLRAFNAPQSQIDQVYIDELQATAREGQNISPKELVERYARYKVLRGAPITYGLYDDVGEINAEQAKAKVFKKKAKERVLNFGDKTVNDKFNEYLDEYESSHKKYQAIKSLDDRVLRNTKLREFMSTTEGKRFKKMHGFKETIDGQIRSMMELKKPERMQMYLDAIESQKRKAIEKLDKIK